MKSARHQNQNQNLPPPFACRSRQQLGRACKVKARPDRHGSDLADAVCPLASVATGLVIWVASSAVAAAPAHAFGVTEEPKPWRPRRHFRGIKQNREPPNYEVRRTHVVSARLHVDQPSGSRAYERHYALAATQLTL